MNALAGCFLSCMTELDAFHALSSFLTRRTPLYWLSSHIGANAGCKLVDQVLAAVDPPLFAHLRATTPDAYVYAFHAVSGFCATIRPLGEVLKLWDFLLAFGPHFNVSNPRPRRAQRGARGARATLFCGRDSVCSPSSSLLSPRSLPQVLCVAAQVVLLRSSLLASSNPKSILDYRVWPALDAGKTVRVALSFLPLLSPSLYEDLCQHATDAATAERISGTGMHENTRDIDWARQEVRHDAADEAADAEGDKR